MPEHLLQQPVQWVDSTSQLEVLCQQWQSVPMLVLDTEFVRSTTYYPKAGLIQMSDGQCNYLIDPLAIDDWFPLVDILDSDDHIIALHACSEDLEVLQMELGCAPKNILDTQIAAALLGYESSLGYAAVIKQVIGHELPKSETRSDWLQRPLSQPQKLYAALDVEYLFPLAQRFIDELKEKDRLTWALEEGRRVYKNYKKLQDVNASYLRIKLAWKLSPKKLSVLMALAKWRELSAQQRDIPRNRLIKEKALFELALQCPVQIDKIRQVEGLPERVIREDGRTLVRLIEEQLNLPNDKWPAAQPKPLKPNERDMLQALKQIAGDVAEQLGIAPELLLRKKECEALIRFRMDENWPALDNFFDGWRKEQFADQLITGLKAL